jgi:ABC-type lipoprotein export system ATPase subunit
MPLLLDDKTGKPLLWKVMEDGHVAEEPNKFQSAILDDDQTTYLWLIGGSGTGKSSLMPIKLFRWIRKKHGGRYLVVEPINKMVDQIARPT